MSLRIAVVSAVTVVALVVLAVLSYSVYSEPELQTESTNWLGLLSPMLVGAVPVLASIGLYGVERTGKGKLLGLGALLAAGYFVVPLYIGLRQQSASDQQLAFAAMFISWL